MRMAWLWYGRFSGFYSANKRSRCVLEYEVGMSWCWQNFGKLWYPNKALQELDANLDGLTSGLMLLSSFPQWIKSSEIV